MNKLISNSYWIRQHDKGIVLNQTCLSNNGESLEITFTVPLKKKIILLIIKSRQRKEILLISTLKQVDTNDNNYDKV